MSTRTTAAILVIAVLLAITIYGLMSGVFLPGSGGLGAVSVDVTVVDVFILSALVCLFFYWQHRRQRRRQPDPPATRA
jgi:predicted Co/Zn/Cd cation transporter (cation efflux family)